MRSAIPALLAAVPLLAPLPARALCEQGCGQFAAVFENDKPSGFDRDYTNGFLLAWSSPAYRPPEWLAPLTGPALRLVVPGDELRWGLSFGQKIYTPNDTAARNPDRSDRPYAAWLFGALTLISSNERQLSSVELQLGMVGPSALGEQVQNNWHDLIGVDRTFGWDAQIEDEPGVNLVLTRQLRLNWETPIEGLSVGIVPSASASLGNVHTYAGAGAMLRIGNALNADFGPPRVRPVSGGSVFYDPPENGGFGWYAFIGVEGRVVGRDITLDGNTWRASRSVERKWGVADASAGLALMYGAARATLTYTIRTEEFAAQRDAARFASLSLAWTF
ncbi:lipid A deacylase LpxR family protein [Falsiroseomonas sp.]|uniref:lipid A deacylase LpxR family protein n=1 Tax=Falsiroseomonas sp. TaxID=2870721 RepID=UPI00356472B0